ncbi:hypothetical protein FBU59_001850 [Linderina macrospora]|uniref:Uncharacterized protein n=1 Tax=Linderina macrospora TaxID=4868 RepID=A0ACC1JCV7_9FUNG|nr:hypothetical protein FBU59_001850 [Linderina macrospora]
MYDRYYAVAAGHTIGVYDDCELARDQTDGYPNNDMRRFDSLEDAEDYIDLGSKRFFNRYRRYVSRGRGPSHTLYVYTDGICKSNGQPGALGGVGVYFGKNDPNNVSEVLKGPRQTNMRADLTSVLRAMQILHSGIRRYDANIDYRVVIYTKSKYVLHCMCEGYDRWVANKWLTSRGNEVQNRSLIKQVVNEHRNSQLRISIEHASTGIGNVCAEAANDLANDAVYNYIEDEHGS